MTRVEMVRPNLSHYDIVVGNSTAKYEDRLSSVSKPKGLKCFSQLLIELRSVLVHCFESLN